MQNETFICLTRILMAEGFSMTNIFLNNFGLGEAEKTIEYYPNTQSFVYRTIHHNSISEGITYNIKTLDKYCQQNLVTHIDFLKVDIEGMEIDFFNGGKYMINNNTKIIQFEFASQKRESR